MRLFPLLCAVVALGLSTVGCAGPAGDGRALAAKSPVEVATTPRELDDLRMGKIVTRALDFERDGASYVGGVASGLVEASPDDVLAAFGDAEAIAAMLPNTKRAVFVDADEGGRRLELLQGNSVVEAKYTIRFVPSETPGELAFQLDRARPHDIDDVYGYFRVRRFDEKRSAVTVAAAVNVGSGLMHMLFGKRVQDVILSAPYTMRTYFADGGAHDRSSLVARNESR